MGSHALFSFPRPGIVSAIALELHQGDKIQPSRWAEFQESAPCQYFSRFSEKQLFTLSMWLCSLEPLANPQLGHKMPSARFLLFPATYKPKYFSWFVFGLLRATFRQAWKQLRAVSRAIFISKGTIQ
jgi:hypothetical protein